MTTISIDSRSLAQLNAAFNRVESVLGSPRRVMQRIGQYQERRFAQSFERDQSPAGQPWTPLAPSTRQRKRNQKTLVETVGRIPSSLFSELRNGGRSVAIGYGDPLATIHHFGAKYPRITIRPVNKRALFWPGANHPVRGLITIPPRTLPARPLVGYTNNDVAEWIAIGQEEIAKAWNF